MKNKGFTLIECLIALFVITFCSSIFIFRINKIDEQNKLEEAMTKIVNFVDEYSLKSLEKKEIFKFTVDSKNKKIEVSRDDYKSSYDEEKLPDNFFYRIPYEEKYVDSFRFSALISINLSKAFSIFIFDSKHIARYRISFYTFEQNKIFKINIYKNRNEKMNEEFILENYNKKNIYESWEKINE